MVGTRPYAGLAGRPGYPVGDVPEERPAATRRRASALSAAAVSSPMWPESAQQVRAPVDDRSM